MKLLTNISYKLDVDTVLSRMRSKQSKKHSRSLERLIGIVKEKVKPKILYKNSIVQPLHRDDDDSISINGILFTSRVLRINLEKAKIVFPYILTCGKTFDDLHNSLDDMMDQFYLSEIGNVLLTEAQSYFLNYLKESYPLKKVSRMNPGSLADWPIAQQKLLFSIFNESAVYEQIGVRLGESMLMTPIKSLSGIAFPTETVFENCQMCPLTDCPARRAPYDESMKDLYFKPE